MEQAVKGTGGLRLADQRRVSKMGSESGTTLFMPIISVADTSTSAEQPSGSEAGTRQLSSVRVALWRPGARRLFPAL